MNKDRFMKNGVFSLEYDKETLKDMVLELQDENKALRMIIKIIIEDQQRSLDQARNFLIKKKKFKYHINDYNNPIIDYSSFIEQFWRCFMKLFQKKNKDVVSQSNLLELNELLKKYELEGASNKDKIDLMVRIKQINTLLNKLNMSKIKKQFSSSFCVQELIFIKFFVFVIGFAFGYFLPSILKFLFRFYLNLKYKEKKYMDLMDNIDNIDNDFWR